LQPEAADDGGCSIRKRQMAKSAFQTMLVGGVAAGAVFYLASLQFLYLAVVSVILIGLSGHGAWSHQATRTIKVVVPVSPGGASDLLARLLAEQIGRAQGQTMLIENRPGASQIIGTEAVSRAAPDGNTLLINSPDSLVIPHLRKLNYDPLTSFEPICYLVRAPLIIVVNTASPYRTLANLLDAARSQPRDFTLASFGPATVHQIAFETLKRAAKVDMTFVPYPGVAPAINALLGEHVTSVLGTYSTVAEQLNAGKLRALATASRTRIEPLPEVPTSLSPATIITRWTTGSGCSLQRRRQRRRYPD
jgi:tripartite-type tricarboxylate transporter receptor subunit TctC